MSSSPSRGWRLHGDGRSIAPGEVVAPGERLTWPRTIGIGVQHVVAMFGATFLVPLQTGFDPATTLFFTGVGTLLFLGITSGRLPSYLGSSFALLAPIGAVTGRMDRDGKLIDIPLDPHKAALAQGGIISVGLCLLVVGVIVHLVGSAWIERLMPPIVTGAIVALIGFNLAPAAWGMVAQGPVTAVVTIVSILVVAVMFKGLIGRLAILIGVLIGYATAALRGEVNFDAVAKAPVLGLPDFHAPAFDVRYLGLFIPVVLVLVAENIGHVKSVSAMTGEDLDDVTGRALFADGLSTMLAGAGGGSGTTTYAENIGVMAATRVYSTAAYVVAALSALGLSLLPKFGHIIAAVPAGVLGGAATVLYGMIGMLGVRIWVQNRVDFSDPVNLNTAAVSMVVAIADYTLVWGDMTFKGIALGSAAAIGVYHAMRWISKLRGTNLEQASPASAPAGTELEGPAYSSRAAHSPSAASAAQAPTSSSTDDAEGAGDSRA